MTNELTKSSEPMTLLDFQRRFVSEEACEQYLFKVRWSDGFICPECKHTKCYRIHGRRLYQCANPACRRQTSVTAGTAMHRSHLPLLKWFWAINLCANDKRGHSALALMRDLKVSYHAAWLMLHKLRKTMSERDFHYILSGVVEVDDACFGGESAKTESGDRHRTSRGINKTKVVVGLATNQNKPAYLKMQVIPVLSPEELSGFVLDHVDPEAVVITDAFEGYCGLSEFVRRHEAKAYAKQPPEFLQWLHTIVGNAKACIIGTYHGLDAKHLQAYLDEFCFRFNRRHQTAELFCRTLATCVDGPWLTYAELTA